MGKRGQLNLSFGMIFSIILIVIFLAVAFYAIQKFLEFQNTANIGKFRNDLQSDVDNLWRGVQGQSEKEYFLPGKIKQICFIDYQSEKTGRYSLIYEELEHLFYERENMFFYPAGSAYGLDSTIINHVNIIETTSGENPYCIENIKGKINIAIKKDFDEALVTIEIR